jgi:hypothetical protein
MDVFPEVFYYNLMFYADYLRAKWLRRVGAAMARKSLMREIIQVYQKQM